MSNSSSSVFATRLVSAASRLTPRLMLPDLTMTARRAAVAISASSSEVRPVVPMMWTRPVRAVSSANAMRRRRDGEIDQPIRLRQQRLDLGGNLDAVHPKPGEFAGIAPDHGRARRFDRARERDAVRRRDGMNERPPHAPAGARHDQPHVRHREFSDCARV